MPTEAAIPRSVQRGPKITLTCECGERNYVRYGERWTCGKCGRTWDTRKIPMDEYAALRHTQLRYRRVPIAIAALSAVCIVVFIVLGKAFAGLILVALVATTWGMFFRPVHSRRYRRAIAELPSWRIDPE